MRGFGISKIVLPPPSAIAVAFWESLRDGELHWHLAVTLYEMLAGLRRRRRSAACCSAS